MSHKKTALVLARLGEGGDTARGWRAAPGLHAETQASRFAEQGLLVQLHEEADPDEILAELTSSNRSAASLK